MYADDICSQSQTYLICCWFWGEPSIAPCCFVCYVNLVDYSAIVVGIFHEIGVGQCFS